MRITLCSIGLTLIFPLAFLSSSVPDTVVLSSRPRKRIVQSIGHQRK